MALDVGGSNPLTHPSKNAGNPNDLKGFRRFSFLGQRTQMVGKWHDLAGRFTASFTAS